MPAAGEFGHHVMRHHTLALELEIHRQRRIAQCHGREVALLRTGIGIAALDVEQRRHARALHRGPAIRRRRRLVHDQYPGRTAPRRLFVLVGPSAVIGHGLAVECARLRRFEIGIVDQHHRNLAAQVHALVVVPLALWRTDAVADEDQWRVLQRDRLLRTQALQGHIVAIDQRLGLAPDAQACAHRAIHLRAHQRHGLGPAALLAAWLQAGRLELLDQVIDRALLTGAGRRAPFEFVRRQQAHVTRQCLGIDAAARQIVGGLRHTSYKQAGRQQQDAHRIHGEALQR